MAAPALRISIVVALVLAVPGALLRGAPEARKSSPSRNARKASPPARRENPAPPPARPTPPAAPPAQAPQAGVEGGAATESGRATAVMNAIEVREKSERAGAVFKKFLEAGSADERLPLILDPKKHEAAVKAYFSTGPNRSFKPLAVQILGSVTSPSNPQLTVFPYFVATDRNKLGFITAVIETREGFKVDWPAFASGHDYSLEEFLSAKKPGETRKFLLGIAKTHIFGDAPPGGEAKWAAYAIEMPLPREDVDPAKVFVEKESAVGRQLAHTLGWSKGHLCYLTLSYKGEPAPFLTATAYDPYTK